MAANKKQAEATKSSPRVRKLTKRSKKKAVKQNKKLDNSLKLFLLSLKHIWRHRKLFGGILLLYVGLTFFIVRGLQLNVTLSDTQTILAEARAEGLSLLDQAYLGYSNLLNTTGSSVDQAGSVYQLMLFIVFSLAIIWSLRTTFENGSKTPKIKSAFYYSTYPLVQFIIVCLIALIQALPAIIGISIYSFVNKESLAVGFIEQLAWLMVLLVMTGVSAYFLSSSILAGYIVTLPKMTPLNALRSAKDLVKYRRWEVIRRLLLLPFLYFLILAVIFMPIVLILPVLAEFLFLVLSLSLVITTHGYLYVLYRELL